MNFQFDTILLTKVINNDRLQEAEKERFFAQIKKNKKISSVPAWFENALQNFRNLIGRSNRIAAQTPVQYLDVTSTINCPSC